MQGPQPSGRRGHSTVVYNGAMHLYGGYQDLKGSSSELWSFHFGKESLVERMKMITIEINIKLTLGMVMREIMINFLI